MEKQKRIPKRRFREFLEAGEWELSILGRLAVEVNRKAEAGSEAPVMMISSGEGFIEQKDRYSTDNAGSSLKNYTLIKQGELSYNHGYSKLRPFGSCFDLRVPEARIPFVYHTFELPKDDSRFYATYLNNGQFDNELKKRVSSTARMDGLLNISYADYMSLEICHPNIEEQTRIGDFCRRLDALISLHQQKLSKLKELKQAYLTEMFPAPGEKRPRRRFKGFSGDWEEKGLGNLYNKIRNAFVGTATPYYVDKGHFYLESNNIKDGKINMKSKIFINDYFYNIQRDNWLHVGDIVVVQSGHVGHSAVIPKELDNTAAHAVIIVSLPQIDIDPYFVNTYLQTDVAKKMIDGITKGNTIKHILASEMKMFPIVYPGIEEQKSIACYFNTLDGYIDKAENRISKLQSLKQAYLSELFV